MCSSEAGASGQGASMASPSSSESGVEIHGYQHHREGPHQDGKAKPRYAPRVAINGMADVLEATLGKQVVHVAYSAAIFIDGDEVACPTTAQWGPREHHFRGGCPEG